MIIITIFTIVVGIIIKNLHRTMLDMKINRSLLFYAPYKN